MAKTTAAVEIELDKISPSIRKVVREWIEVKQEFEKAKLGFAPLEKREKELRDQLGPIFEGLEHGIVKVDKMIVEYTGHPQSSTAYGKAVEEALQKLTGEARKILEEAVTKFTSAGTRQTFKLHAKEAVADLLGKVKDWTSSLLSRINHWLSSVDAFEALVRKATVAEEQTYDRYRKILREIWAKEV